MQIHLPKAPRWAVRAIHWINVPIGARRIDVLLLVVGPALANSFTADVVSQPNGAQDVTLTLGPLSKTVSAGEIGLHQNIPAADLLVWCLDVKDTLFVPYTYTVQTYTAGDGLPGLPAGGLNAAQSRQIASLMFRGLSVGGPDANQDNVATQLAIWQVEYENIGGITYSNLSAPLSARLALLLLNSANNGLIDCPTCSITILTDDLDAPNQALGFATQAVAVPGPVVGAGLPGLLAGLLGIWGYRRRRA